MSPNPIPRSFDTETDSDPDPDLASPLTFSDSLDLPSAPIGLITRSEWHPCESRPEKIAAFPT
ncbi:MAG: hypothetical protein ACOX52_07070 [Verrucomicrobiota bacterium]